MNGSLDRDTLLDGLVEASLQAGAAIERHRAKGVAVAVKADASPVTAADQEAEAILLVALAQLAPGVPVVAEEEAAAGRTPDVDARFFLVDPLDGTKEFVRGGDDFTVNVGLIEDGVPTLGVIYAPAMAALWSGDTRGDGAWKAHLAPDADPASWRAIRHAIACAPPTAAYRVAASRSHGAASVERYLETLAIADRISVGSSIKFAWLAEGRVDLYPRGGPTMEWDTAAGHAIVLAAGGRVAGLDGAPLAYAKPGFLNPGFVATGPFDAPALGPFMAMTPE